MKNVSTSKTISMQNHRRRFLKIIIPIALIFIMGVNCFASPTDTNNNSSPATYYPSSGQIYCGFRSFTNYGHSYNFAVGPTGYGSSVDFSNISTSFVYSGDANDSVLDCTAYYTTNFISDGCFLYAPVFQATDGYPAYYFNATGTVSISYEYYDDSSKSWLRYSNTISTDLDQWRSLVEFTDWQPVVEEQFVLNYTLFFTPSSPTLFTVGIRDFYSTHFSDVMRSFLDNTQYQSGWLDGRNELNKEFTGILDRAKLQAYDYGYEQGIIEASGQIDGIGSFIDVMLNGQYEWNPTTQQFERVTGGLMNTQLFGDSYPWITIGNVLGAFVALSLTFFILKLFLGG